MSIEIIIYWTHYYIPAFIIYSFFGWIIESSYRSISEKEIWINSGFLYGPFIPVYGFGAIGVLLLEKRIGGYPFLLQIILFCLFATLIEYATSVLLEKKFSIRLWDYSNMPLNIHGRVCLLHSSFWAGLSVLLVMVVHPVLSEHIKESSTDIRSAGILLFTAYLSTDLFYSTRFYHRFTKVLLYMRELNIQYVSTELREKIEHLHLLKELKRFLRPLYVFPHLREELADSMSKLPELSLIPSFKEARYIIFNKLQVIKLDFDKLDNDDPSIDDPTIKAYLKEFQALGREIIEHPQYQQLKQYKHHDKTIYTHNLKVAWIAFLLGKKMKLNLKEMVRGALMHDFFFYDWRIKGAKQERLPHGFTHPSVSKQNAEKIFGPLTPIEKDIIMKHMWPLTIIPPKYPESFLVSMIDKLVAGKEFTQDMVNANSAKDH